MTASISSVVKTCFKSFNSLIEEVKTAKLGDVGPWNDELGRLRMWTANIGAHQNGQSSLEFRLKDASHMYEQVLNLLDRLSKRLQNVRDMMTETQDSEEEEDPKLSILDFQESIATVINYLFQMSVLIRKPTQHDLHVRSKHIDVSAFQPFDQSHVRDKFPNADISVVRRLGSAITRRRRYLKYREKHAQKLEQGLDKVARRDSESKSAYETGTAKASILSDTVATAYQQQGVDFDDNISNTEMSETSYASTLMSGGRITIPTLPKESYGGLPFQCPYCSYVITVKGTHSWNKHVFQDLQPYICVAKACVTPDKLYSTRREWLNHIRSCRSTPTSHSREINDTFSCPLCHESIESLERWDRHIARHLQELALFVLPRDEDSSDQSGNEKNLESKSDSESGELRSALQLPADLNSQIDAFSDGNVSTSSNQEKAYLPDNKSQHSDKDLMDACLSGNETMIKSLLNTGVDVNAKSGEALRVASQNGHLKVVKLLLNHGADINAQGGHLGNALQAASREGHELILRTLLEHGADINAQGGFFDNALQAASFHKHETIVKLLLNNGANVNAHGGNYGNALRAASSRGHETVVKLLLDHGADINAQDGHHGNALQAASSRGHETVVKLSLDHGADMNAQLSYYGNALQAASREGHEIIVRLLLDHGADINAQNGYYGNALRAAMRRPNNEAVIQLLREHGAKEDESYSTPLYLQPNPPSFNPTHHPITNHSKRHSPYPPELDLASKKPKNKDFF